MSGRFLKGFACIKHKLSSFTRMVSCVRATQLIVYFKNHVKMLISRASEILRKGKGTCSHALWPHSNPWDAHFVLEGDLASENCLLVSTSNGICALVHTPTHTHTIKVEWKRNILFYLWVSANIQTYSKKKIPECSLVARIWKTTALKYARIVPVGLLFPSYCLWLCFLSTFSGCLKTTEGIDHSAVGASMLQV